jgi:hypothetical protein
MNPREFGPAEKRHLSFFGFFPIFSPSASRLEIPRSKVSKHRQRMAFAAECDVDEKIFHFLVKNAK